MGGAVGSALVVDLGNFARYPPLAVGYLVAALRGGGWGVEVVSPPARGGLTFARERPESLADRVVRRMQFASHPAAGAPRDLAARIRTRVVGRARPGLVAQVRAALAAQPDVLLLSAYLDHRPSVVALSALAAARGVPVVVGGPFFNVPGVAPHWLRIRGVHAVVGREVDLCLPELLDGILGRTELTDVAGVFLADGRGGGAAEPLRDVDRLPIPDFDDFPWERYPTRVVPVMTGRGCGWGACTFCGDVISANGRTYRSRPLSAVLDEIEHQARRYATSDVVFLDMKLNSDLAMWHGLIDGIPRRVPGARWIGAVHVGRGHNGLSREELEAAAAAGMTRVTFGLETGSDRLNAAMRKGTTIDRMSTFLRDARDAGISVRTTVMLGYPGEGASEVEQTTAILRAHRDQIDRVRLTRFKPIPGTPFARAYEQVPARFDDLARIRWDSAHARGAARDRRGAVRTYRRARSGLLRVVHEINRRPLRPGAESFDGLM